MTKLRSFLLRHFPPRQLILRTDGVVRMLELRTWQQVAAAGVGLMLLVWLGFSAAGMLVLNNVIDSKDVHIGKLASKLQGLDRQHQKVRGRVEVLSDQLRGKNEQLVVAVQQKYAVHKRMTELTKQLEMAMARAQEKDARKHELQTRIQNLKNEVRAAVLFSKKIANDAAAAEKSRDSTVRMVMKLSEDRDNAVEQQERLKDVIGELQTRIASLRLRQRGLFSQIEKQTRQNIYALEKTIRDAGLDVWTMLARAGDVKAGVGGPFEPTADSTKNYAGDIEFLSAGPVFRSRSEQTETYIHEWTKLSQIVEKLPLAEPLENLRVTSHFGPRRDPFNNSMSFHPGLDMVGGYRAAVRATGPGVVLSAGWKGEYGKAVMIDHGNGIVTLYGHLRSISVHKGDKVSNYQQIGVVGSTGRSTSSHLHYEVRYDGKAVNPVRFLKAGNNVLKG